MKNKLKKVCFSVIIIILFIIAILVIRKKSVSDTEEYKTPSVAYPVEVLNTATEEDNIESEENIMDGENVIDIEIEETEF
jgi:hypothetical protein